MFWLMKILLFIPFSILFPCVIHGKNNIPKGTVILVCNHRSNIDYCYLFNRIWRKQFVLAKKSLFKRKLLSAFLKSCGGIPVNRDKVELETIKMSLSVLKNNKVLTIFPEGTRNKTNEDLLEFKAGASVFAIKSNAPIVPIYITKRPRFFCINKIEIGDPIYFNQDYKGEDGTNRANNVIKSKMLELKFRK